MALLDRIKDQIRATGPLSVPQYMEICLHDPQDGYYATRPALGEAGDFITAPLASQMFGEIIGVWLIESWRRLGRPARFRLVEMGPGDGTLMLDIQRTVRQDPAFLAGQDLWLVETSIPLKKVQAERLGRGPQWATSLAGVPTGVPLLLVANELLDCLPARQFIRTQTGWSERGVGLDKAENLIFGLMAALPTRIFPHAPVGAVVEVSAAQENLARDLARRIIMDGGAALLIDYGRAEPGFGDTLQALSKHKKVSPLAEPGQADLTIHADFPAFIQAASAEGLPSHPILTQGKFLTAMGIIERAQALAAARPDRFDVLERQLSRLISPQDMGDLFKVICLAQPGLIPPAFETP
ncbi:MAG: SAM-dependent methyltransferase [Phenylobacterium zucineum]|nr:MAG: SAM-dependent methyltransferase [Phenylobacterium zucineum]